MKYNNEDISIKLEKDDIIILVLFVLFVLSLIFIVVGHFYHEGIQDRLKQNLITIGHINIDWWSISHMVLFFTLGYIKPDRHLQFLILGIAWELTEDYLATNSNRIVLPNKMELSPNYGMSCCQVAEKDNYWYAKADDILMNVIGYAIGSRISPYRRR
jgi:hypothetical protein